MTIFRDWPRTLQAASYRGVPFQVSTDDIETGRRLVVHQFPHKNEPYVEDLGRDANKIAVTAYVLGDDADSAEKRLRRACETGGAAQLVLPIDRLMAHCESCKRDFAKDKLGYIAFSLKFVREGSGAAPFPVGFLAAVLGQAAASVALPLETYAAAAYSTAGGRGQIQEAAATAIRDAAAVMLTVAEALPMTDAARPPALAALAALWADADVLAAGGARGHVWEPRAFLSAETTLPVTPLVTRLAGAVDGLAAAALTPADTVRELVPLRDLRMAPPGPPGETPGWFREVANAEAVAAIVRVQALVRWVEAVAGQSYADRRAAIQARADIAEAVDAEIETIAGPAAHGLATALRDLRGRAVELLSRRIADLAPVLALEMAAEMPSLWLSNYLYGTADRAAELRALNRVRHPSFMPRRLEALAS